MEGLILAWTGLLGACVGSFTNVVAWRLPRQESVVFPGSHCPKCGHAIRWHDNLPVLGWLLLRGRCRDCDAAISWRYPAVEALSAGLWISALLVWPGAGGGLPDLWLPWAGFPLIALLLPLVLIDLDHLWLPEPLCRWGVVLGLLVSTAAGIPVLASHLIAAVLALLLLEGLSALAERFWDSLRWALAMPSWRRWVGHGWAPGASQRRWPLRLSRELWLEAPLASVAGWAPGNRSPSVPSLPWASGWSG